MDKQGVHIDLGIAVLATIVKPGQFVNQQTIADVCGCSKQRIFLIEKKALAKVRERLSINDYL